MKEDAKATDWSLIHSTDFDGLISFQRSDPVSITPGAEKFYVNVEDLPLDVQQASMGHRRRVCYEDKRTRETWLACIWSTRGPALHLTADIGLDSVDCAVAAV